MKEVNVLIKSPERAGKFIKILQKYSCEFDLEAGQGCVDAKSLIGVMSLNLKSGAKLLIHADEEEATEVIRNIADYVVQA